MALDDRRKARVDEWLSRFSEAVRKGDYESGRALFCNDVESFGTVAAHVEDLDSLEADQWRNVWDQTKDFNFEPDTIRYIISNDYVVVLARWISHGTDAEGSRFLRAGRCTIVLRDSGGGQEYIQACHTHFSMNPEASS